MPSLAGFPLANPASRRSSRFRAFLPALSSIRGRRAISPDFTRAAPSTNERAKNRNVTEMSKTTFIHLRRLRMR